MWSYKILSSLFIKNLRIHSRSIITSTYKDAEIPKITVAEYFFRHAELYPNNIAYIDDTRNIKYSYCDTQRCIHSIASALTKKGVKLGTMVGIVASNSPEYFMLILAISSMGCSVMMCNQNYTKEEMKYQLNDSQPSILFTDVENLNKVAKVASEIATVKDLYVIGDRVTSNCSVQDLLEDSGNMSPIGEIDIDVDNHVAMMPYSSGTTGLPKGVMITHKNLVANMIQLKVARPIDGFKTMMITLPLYHIYGVVVVTAMAFTSGSCAVVQPKFDPIKFLTAIERYKVNVLHLVPPQVLFLLNYPDVSKYDLSSVEWALCGAAPLDAALERRLVERLQVKQPTFNIIQGYGMSETSPLTHITPCNSLKKPGSVGTLIPNMKCKVVDVSSGEELGPNEQGELLLQGPNIMKGYYGNSAATEATFKDGWLKTGDIVYYDEDQYFYVVDRSKELIKVKGYQVAPAEIEAVLLSHPAIVDCGVIGIPHNVLGEVPKAFVVKSKDVDENEIHRFLSERLSAHKHLKGGIVFVDKIPKSPSGKILRRLLK